MSGPFKDVRVLELTSTVSGPFAGMMLADQGADCLLYTSDAADDC